MPAFSLKHGLRYFTFLLPFLMSAQAAHAGSRESRDNAAKTACLSGDYAKGVALLAKLFVDTADIAYLFNQGRCYEQNGRYADAIIRFREYLRKNKDVGNATDAEAERHIADCQALLGTQTPQAAPPAQPMKPATDSSPVPPPAAAQVPFVLQTAPAAPASLAPRPQPDVTQATPASTSPGSGLRIGGIATMAVGVAGIATGVLLNLKANSLSGEIQRSNTSYSRSKDSTRASYQTFSWVGYGAGAAFVAGGALLYYLGHGQSQSAQLALVPKVQPGQLGVGLQGVF